MNPKAIKRFKKLRAIFKSLKSGSTISAACKAAVVDVSTLWEWRKANKELNVKIHNIIESRIQAVEDALFESAIGGNVTAQLAFLFNRAPERWADKRALINNIISNKLENANPYKNLTDEELRLLANDAKINEMKRSEEISDDKKRFPSEN